jgi:two-component system sensor histidine kinase DesK
VGDRFVADGVVSDDAVSTEDHGGRRRSPQERQARAVFVAQHVSLLSFVVVQCTTGFESRWSWWGVLSLVVAACQVHHSRAATHGRRARGWPLTFGLQVATVVVLQVVIGDASTSLLIIVGASAAMVLPGRYPILWVIPEAVAAVVLDYARALHAGDPTLADWWWWTLVYSPMIFALGAGGLTVSAHLVDQMSRLQRTRIELAEAAVQRERLRVARDLHDLLGQSLSAVVLKGELAMRLYDSDPDRSRREVEDLAAIAGTTLADLRAVTRDRRDTGLRDEVAGAARLLTAAGMRADVDVDIGALPVEVDRLLGWTLREGITNVLRHSDATWCTVRAIRDGGSVVLEIVNDRPAPAVGTGCGLAGLDARARELGGRLVTEHTADRFVLRLDVPMEPA